MSSVAVQGNNLRARHSQPQNGVHAQFTDKWKFIQKFRAFLSRGTPFFHFLGAMVQPHQPLKDFVATYGGHVR